MKVNLSSTQKSQILSVKSRFLSDSDLSKNDKLQDIKFLNKLEKAIDLQNTTEAKELVKIIYKNSKNTFDFYKNFPDHSHSPISLAIMHENTELIEYFLKNKLMDANQQDHLGLTPLHLAFNHGSIKMIKILLNYEADIRLKTNKGKNCLHIAAYSGNFAAVKFIVEKKILDINSQTFDDKKTALHYCVGINLHQDIAMYLILHGADLSIKDIKHHSVLDRAAYYRHTEIVTTFRSFEIFLRKNTSIFSCQSRVPLLDIS